MSELDLIFRGRRVVLPDRVGPASIRVRAGRIFAIAGFDEVENIGAIVEADDDEVILPGLVDTHVHINSPGRTEWEGFETATKAAAAGGVTTVVDMPLNSIPATTSAGALRTKLDAARNNCYIDVGFWGGVVPGNQRELAKLKEAGVVGFKCFLVPSGVDEFPAVTEADLRQSMPELTRLDSLLIVHAELPGPIDKIAPKVKAGPAYSGFLASRPKAAENDAIELMIQLSREFATRVHIVHLSSAEAIPMIRQAQADGVRITAETCPHYLHFAAEAIPSGATEFKCCPPIREHDNREELWKGLADGTIAMVVSDHSPCPAEMKLQDSGDFIGAWGGIASLQLRLPAVWTEAQRRGFSIFDLANWLCRAPSQQVRLHQRKGLLQEGFDADVVFWKPQEQFVVEPAELMHRHKITPYAGENLLGVVEKTFIRGRKVYDGREVIGPPAGQLLLRP